MMKSSRNGRMLEASVLALAMVVFLTGCERMLVDAVQKGFFGWVSATTTGTLNTYVPFP